jgi:hypothetical protein
VIGHNCPHCNAIVKSVNIAEVTGVMSLQPRWRCISYSCQTCGKVISIEMDSFALKREIIDGLMERLRK